MNIAGKKIAEILCSVKQQAVIDYHLFLPIYEYNLYVYLYKNDDAIKRKLLDDGIDPETVDDINYEGAGHFIPNDTCGVMIFPKEIWFDTLIHEVAHVRQEVLERAGFYDGTLSSALAESEAYLEGWLADELVYMLAHHIAFKDHSTKTIPKESNIRLIWD